MVLQTNNSPLARKRVLYIGSAVPLDTASGLECIQGPLRERYPVDQNDGIEGIDSHVSVTHSYIQLQYVNDPDQIIQFPISTLSLCAAVRCVTTVNGASGEKMLQFVSLNDSLAGGENAEKPAIFTTVTRRTQGRKVLECHGFICHSPQDALELVKMTSLAGKNYKKNGSVKTPRQQAQQHRVLQHANSNGSANHDANYAFTPNTSNRNSATSSINMTNGVTNSIGRSEKQPSMRLIPAEPITIKAGPEFYEPVSKQGYFYSSDKAEVKKFSIAKLQKQEDNKENSVIMEAPVLNGHGPAMDQPFNTRQVPVMNGYGPPPHARPVQQNSSGPPPPIYIRMQREPPQPRPFAYGPPQHPHPMMYNRPRFFSPPPPRLRPPQFMVPPGAPPPMMAPPIFIRRPREPSRSGSRSNSAGSHDSRSKSPKENDENTEPKRMPNGDANSSSDDTITLRPLTPPKDYSKPKSKGQRRSRRDDYESRQIGPSQQGPYLYPPGHPGNMYPPGHPGMMYHPGHPGHMYPTGPQGNINAPHPYDYYVNPPRHGGYAPFTMYDPHSRSRSLPPDPRFRSSSPKKKGKKHKKNKKKKQRNYEQRGHPKPRSDVSTDSYAGYHSEIPRYQNPEISRSRPATTEPETDYQFYPPRDFRRGDKQFMNERNFSKSIIAETRRSRDSKAYPTAYELNDAMDRQRPAEDGEPDFNLY